MLIELSDTNNHIRVQLQNLDFIYNFIGDLLINPILAGGAPRNFFFNFHAVDLDIFVEVNTDIDKIYDLIKDNPLFSSRKLQQGEGLPEQYLSPYINAVLTFSYNGSLFQIIRKSYEYELLSSFPVSLSLITYKDGILYPHNFFLHSIRTGSMYLKQRESSDRFIEKYRKNFSKFQILFANENSW